MSNNCCRTTIGVSQWKILSYCGKDRRLLAMFVCRAWDYIMFCRVGILYLYLGWWSRIKERILIQDWVMKQVWRSTEVMIVGLTLYWCKDTKVNLIVEHSSYLQKKLGFILLSNRGGSNLKIYENLSTIVSLRLDHLGKWKLFE